MHCSRMVPTLLLLLMVLSLAGTARAADFSFFVGAELPGAVEKDDVKNDLDNGPIYGFRLGYDFVPHFGMEHTLALSSDFMFPSDAAGAVEDANGFIYSSNLVVNFPVRVKNAVPYLTGGIGLIHQYGDRNLPVGSKFAFNYGGGLKFPRLAGPLGARIDLRGYRAGAFSDKLNVLEISFGVMLSLGR